MRSKDAMYREFKRQKFEEISSSPQAMFNFFSTNNDIFRFISPQDERIINKYYYIHENRLANTFFGSMAAVFVTDQILMRYLMPTFRINSWRPLVFAFKYMLIPCVAYSICRSYFMEDVLDAQERIHNKYDFGFEDYMRATRIWDRAYYAGRLEELFEKRGAFDWRGVPELPPEDNSGGWTTKSDGRYAL